MDSDTVTYRFAKTENEAICIDQLSRDTRHTHGVLTCFGCNKEMSAVLGEKVAHHFRHKADNFGACGKETYLHWMTKTRISEILTNMVEKGMPLILQRSDGYAHVYVDKNDVELTRNSFETELNLLEDVVSVSLETPVGSARPDVCLHRSNGTKIFFEVAVTHACEEEKIKAGNEIVEIFLKTEDEAESFFSAIETHQKLCEEESVVAVYNFPIEEKRIYDPKIESDILEQLELDRREKIFTEKNLTHRTIYASKIGRVTDFDGAFFRNEEFEEIELCVPRELSPIQVVDGYCSIKRFEKQEFVKSCLICRHHSFAYVKPNEKYKEIWCRKHKRQNRHTQALTCKDVVPFKSFEDLREHRKAIANSGKAPSLAKEMVPPKEGVFKLDPFS